MYLQSGYVDSGVLTALELLCEWAVSLESWRSEAEATLSMSGSKNASTVQLDYLVHSHMPTLNQGHGPLLVI